MLSVETLRDWGADVDEALVRCLNNESFYLMLVQKAVKDPNFDRLPEAIAAGDPGKAFEAQDGYRLCAAAQRNQRTAGQPDATVLIIVLFPFPVSKRIE